MHYYKKNIGDYHKKAGRLSMLEHGAYTLLLDACYDRERFPTMAEALDWAWARTEAEEAAVRFVLSKFFTLTDGVYVQERIKEEIDTYRANAATNARIAKEREQKRRERKENQTERARSVHEACESVNEAPPNHKPLTINQEPNTPHTPQGAAGGAVVPDIEAELPEAHALPKPRHGDMPTSGPHPDAGKICAAMKRAGLGEVNPGHPKLHALLHSGMTEIEAIGVASEAAQKAKGFPWALAVLERQRKEAAEFVQSLAMGGAQVPGAIGSPPRRQNKQEALEASNRAVGDEWVREMMAREASNSL